MKGSIIGYNGPILYKNLSAKLQDIGDGYAVMKFVSSGIEPLTRLHQFFVDEFANGNLVFQKAGELPPTNRVEITPQAQIAEHRQQVYLNELRLLCEPSSKNVGGLELRRKAILKGQKILGDKKPPSPSTLGNWAKAENTKLLGAAEIHYSKRKRKRKTIFSDEVMMHLMEAIDEELTGAGSKHFTFANIERTFQEKIKKADKQLDRVPGYGRIKQIAKGLIWSKAKKSGLSSGKIKELLRNAVKMFITTQPLERVEADGIHLQIGVYDEDGNYLGPVTIIIILDVHTRCILGYCMRVGRGESSSAVIHAIRHALCPKPEGSFHTTKGNEWFCYGVFENFVVDGGSAFQSIATQSYLRRVCGVFTETVPTASGWLKPFVERFNWTIRVMFASVMPGYTGPMKDQKLLEHSIREAATLTLLELREYFESWIVDDYHHRPHSGLGGKTPAEVWQEAIDAGWCPEIPLDMETVRLPQGEECYRTVLGEHFHQGVVIENVEYNVPDGRLKEIAKYLVVKGVAPIVMCEYNNEDLSTISILDPRTDEMFAAFAKNQELREKRITRTEHAIQLAKKKERLARTAPNTLAENERLKAQRDAHRNKTSKKTKRKQQNANPEKVDEEIQKSNSNKPGSAVDDQYNPAKDIDFGSLKKRKDDS